jgi:energy-coupling factor transporter transmembrane protein EcfT
MSRPFLAGVPRFAVYFVFQVAVFSSGLPWLGVFAVALALLGRAEGLRWIRWLARSRVLVIVALLPAIAGFPWDAASGGLEAFWILWEPSLVRAARLGLVLASAAWLSRGMSPVQLRDALETLLRPLGRLASGRIARAASLTMAFIPWTAREMRIADEAARLRGSDPRRRPGRHLAALSVPLVARSLEKARRAAEALTLRDPRFGG